MLRIRSRRFSAFCAQLNSAIFGKQSEQTEAGTAPSSVGVPREAGWHLSRTDALTRESQERLLSFIQSLPGPAWVKDAEGRYCFVNDYLVKLHKLAAADWLTRLDSDLFPSGQAYEFKKNDGLVLESGKPQQTIEKGIEGDTTRYFLVCRFPVRTGNATMLGGVAIDLTERLQAEQDLADAREELLRYENVRLTSELSSTLAHELNNVLNALTLRLSLMGESPALRAQDSTLERLTRLINSAADSVRRMQELSRGQQQNRSLQPLRIDAVVREALAAVSSRIVTGRERPGLQVVLAESLSAQPPVLGVVPDVLHIFVNLLLHAYDALPAGGALIISAQPADARVIVTVSSEETAITEQKLRGFLDPFAVSRAAATSRAGVSLSMAAGVMALLGGTVEIASTPGNRAVIRFSFPSAEKYEVASTTQKNRIAEQPSRRILLIDDDADNLEAMQAAFELRGYDVTTASNGADALRLLQSAERFDSMICDLGMPGMSGWEVAQEAAHIAPAIPVYLVTGWADAIPQDDPRRNLVTAVLAKPIDLEQIDNLLAYRNSRGGHRVSVRPAVIRT